MADNTTPPVKAEAREKKRVNFLVDAEIYDKTFGDERWDLRLGNSEYLELVLRDRLENSAG